MANSAFESALRRRLDARGDEARAQWFEAGRAAGVDEDEWTEIVHSIGERLTWILWDIAIEEASSSVV